MRTVFLFSGQGSQYYQMGQALYAGHPSFRARLDRLDTVARDLTGSSVVATLYAPEHRSAMAFDRTLLSHPAIVMVEYALAQTLIEAGITPDLVLGASLGSYAAASVAGLLPIEEALALAVAHARALEQHCAPGGMLAVLDDPALCEQPFIATRAVCAGVNFDSHFVLSAQAAACDAVEAELRARALAYQRLPVSFAFHSRWIDGAAPVFAAATTGVRPARARVPLMCCDQARLLETVDPDFFWNVTRRPIRFAAAIAALEAQGSYRYLDVGPAGTLAVFLKYLLPAGGESSAQSILTPYGQDLAHLERLLALA